MKISIGAYFPIIFLVMTFLKRLGEGSLEEKYLLFYLAPLIFAFVYIVLLSLIIRYCAKNTWIELSKTTMYQFEAFRKKPKQVNWSDAIRITANGRQGYHIVTPDKKLTIYSIILEDPESFEKHIAKLVLPRTQLPEKLKRHYDNNNINKQGQNYL